MKKRAFLSLFLLLATSLACYAPSLAGQSPAVTEPSDGTVATQTQALPTEMMLTPIPTDITTAVIFTVTSSAPMVQAGAQDVNCRYGPATAYLAVGYLLKTYVTPILGVSEDGSWWYIQDPRQAGIYCFVAKSVTVALGDTSSVAKVPTPNSRVINVNVLATVPTAPVPCVGGFPVSIGFSATIETNGPGLVTWRWELSQGNISANSTLMYTAFGAQTVMDNHNAGAAGDYWVRVHVLSPNDIYGQANYHVSCTP